MGHDDAEEPLGSLSHYYVDPETWSQYLITNFKFCEKYSINK